MAYFESWYRQHERFLNQIFTKIFTSNSSNLHNIYLLEFMRNLSIVLLWVILARSKLFSRTRPDEYLIKYIYQCLLSFSEVTVF